MSSIYQQLTVKLTRSANLQFNSQLDKWPSQSRVFNLLNNLTDVILSHRYLIYVSVNMRRWESEAATFLDWMMVTWLVCTTVFFLKNFDVGSFICLCANISQESLH